MAFCLCDRISCDQKWLIKDIICFHLWFQKTRVHDGGRGLGSQSWGLREDIFNHRQEAEKWKWDGLWPLRALPQQRGFISKAPPLKGSVMSSKQHTCWDQAFKHTSLWGHFPFKPPQSDEAKLGLIKEVRVATKEWVCISLERITPRWLYRSYASDFEVTRMCQDMLCNEVPSLKVSKVWVQRVIWLTCCSSL